MHGEPSRRFTILDALALVAAVGVGLALARAYQTSMDSAASGVAMTYPLRIRWFGRPVPLLISLTITLFVLRLIGPRPRYERLVGSPGFAACYGAALGLAITALTVVMRLGTGYLGYSRSQVPLHYLMMSSVNFAGPSVASVWVALGLLGRWRRERDWVEVSGIVVGFGWLALLLLTQLNF